MKTFKNKDFTKFVRFGGLDLKNQKGFGRDTFHAPPASRGFYAFPKFVQEFFLIGSMNSFQPGTYPKELESGSDIKKQEAYWKRRDLILSNIRKEFTKSEGNIWHHLEEYTSNHEIVDRHGSWVKTSIKEWKKAFSKMSLDHRYGLDPKYGFKSINDINGITGYFSKDHCEVFFDEKVS